METSSGGTEVMIQPMIQWVLSLFSFYALNCVPPSFMRFSLGALIRMLVSHNV